MANLVDVWSVGLNKRDMFKHFIEFKNKENHLLASIKVLPGDSDEKFQEFYKKWVEARTKAGLWKETE